MAYIASDKIGVFPLSKNRTSSTPLNSRLFYESNVSNIINQVMDTDGFVITNTNDTVISGNQFNQDFEFNLYGYYFKILNGTTLSLGNGPVYASIILGGEPQEIVGQDVNDEYTGLILTNSLTAIQLSNEQILKSILILDDEFKIPEESKIKFNLSTLGITSIDGRV